jgi:hypothetical protein
MGGGFGEEVGFEKGGTVWYGGLTGRIYGMDLQDGYDSDFWIGDLGS